MILKLIILLLSASLAVPTLSSAVNVSNLTMGQLESRAWLRYDLSGELGEHEADVTINLVVGSSRYDAGRLGLKGDVGKKISIGPGKMAIWDVLQSYPGGFDQDATWEITVTESNSMTDIFTGMKLKLVKGGCFQMGAVMNDNAFPEEKPIHEVCLDNFYIGKYEVTQGEYEKVMGVNPSNFKQCGANCPVELVSWNYTQEFIKKLNLLTGKSYRLPTEAEWEYAAREGGKNLRFGTGSDTITSATANFDASAAYKKSYSEVGEYRAKTVPAGSFTPNGLGLYDMSGNVWEWVSDWYGEKYYSESPRNNPQGPTTGQYKVLRGGSWGSEPDYLRASKRYRYGPDYYRTNYFGFRLVHSSLD